MWESECLQSSKILLQKSIRIHLQIYNFLIWHQQFTKSEFKPTSAFLLLGFTQRLIKKGKVDWPWQCKTAADETKIFGTETETWSLSGRDSRLRLRPESHRSRDWDWDWPFLVETKMRLRLALGLISKSGAIYFQVEMRIDWLNCPIIAFSHFHWTYDNVSYWFSIHRLHMGPNSNML